MVLPSNTHFAHNSTDEFARFYCREALSPGAHVELPELVARHAVRVLRLPPGRR